MVAGILERLIRDLRHTTGGMPDLVVWNTRTKKVKVSMVTVKVSIKRSNRDTL